MKRPLIAIAVLLSCTVASLATPTTANAQGEPSSKRARITSTSGVFSDEASTAETNSNRKKKSAKHTKKSKRVAYEAKNDGTSSASTSDRDEENSLTNPESGSTGEGARLSTREPRLMKMQEPHAWTVHLHPISGLVRIFEADLNRQISTSWTAGGIFRYSGVDIGLYKETSTGAGVKMTGFSHGPFSDSFYISPSLFYRRGYAESNVLALIGSGGNFQATTGQLLVGYQWHWTNFNLGLALGGQYTSVQYDQTSIRFLDERAEGNFGSYSGSGGSISGELALGYSF